MAKFKVGDRVKISTSDSYNGGSGVVAAVNSNGWYLIDGESASASFLEVELALIDAESVSTTTPNYYLLPTGIQVIDVTRWLTGNAAQAVQYIARSSRVDEVYKGDRVKDLRKALDFINNEIERLELGDV